VVVVKSSWQVAQDRQLSTQPMLCMVLIPGDKRLRRSLFLCNTSGLFDLDLQAELEFYREMKVCPDVKRLTMYGNTSDFRQKNH